MSPREKKLLIFFATAGFLVINLLAFNFYQQWKLAVERGVIAAREKLRTAEMIRESRDQVADEMDWLAEREPEPAANQDVQTKLQQLCEREARTAGLTIKNQKPMPSDTTGTHFHRAKMLLAAAGLPKASVSGYELLTQLPMGTSRSVEQAKLKQAQESRLLKEAAFDTAITARALYCEAAQPDDDAALASSGLPLRGEPQPVGDMPAPANLRATMGDQSGEIDLQWDAIYGASSYVIECREYSPPTGWSQVKFLNQSKFTVTGLTSGKTYAFRVRALGPKGEGPWSDEAVKMAS